MWLQSANRVVVGSPVSRLTSGCFGLISRIGLTAGTAWPAAFRMRSRFMPMSHWSLTEAGRRLREPVRHAHALDLVAERLAHAVRDGRQRRRFLLLRRLVALVRERAQIELALGDRLQRFAVELVEAAQHPLVHAVVQQQHLDALLAEDLEVRAVAWPPRSCRR